MADEEFKPLLEGATRGEKIVVYVAFVGMLALAMYLDASDHAIALWLRELQNDHLRGASHKVTAGLLFVAQMIVFICIFTVVRARRRPRP